VLGQLLLCNFKNHECYCNALPLLL